MFPPQQMPGMLPPNSKYKNHLLLMPLYSNMVLTYSGLFEQCLLEWWTISSIQCNSLQWWTPISQFLICRINLHLIWCLHNNLIFRCDLQKCHSIAMILNLNFPQHSACLLLLHRLINHHKIHSGGSYLLTISTLTFLKISLKSS